MSTSTEKITYMVNYPDVKYVGEIWSSAMHLRTNIVNAILLITRHYESKNGFYTDAVLEKVALNPRTVITVEGDTLEYIIYGLGERLKGKLSAQVIDDLIYGEIDTEEARKRSSEYLDSFETDEEDLEESTKMGLKEAKQILEANGCRLLKESDGYTFRIAGGKVDTHVTGGKYGDKSLRYEERKAADVLGADTLEREYTDANDLEKKVIEDICGGDLSKVEGVNAGVMHHLDRDNAATFYISVSFVPALGVRSRYKKKVYVHANLIITGSSGAGAVDADDLATLLKAQLNARNGEIKDLRSSQEYRKFESRKGNGGRLLKESSYYTISLPVVKISVGGRDYFANGVTATGELTAGCGSRGEDEFEIDPDSVVPDVSYWTVGDSEVGETPDMVAELCDVLAGLEGWEVPDTDEYHI